MHRHWAIDRSLWGAPLSHRVRQGRSLELIHPRVYLPPSRWRARALVPGLSWRRGEPAPAAQRALLPPSRARLSSFPRPAEPLPLPLSPPAGPLPLPPAHTHRAPADPPSRRSRRGSSSSVCSAARRCCISRRSTGHAATSTIVPLLRMRLFGPSVHEYEIALRCTPSSNRDVLMSMPQTRAVSYQYYHLNINRSAAAAGAGCAAGRRRLRLRVAAWADSLPWITLAPRFSFHDTCTGSEIL